MEPQRRSTRDIKRRKFDDELVESDLGLKKTRPELKSPPATIQPEKKKTPVATPQTPTAPIPPPPAVTSSHKAKKGRGRPPNNKDPLSSTVLSQDAIQQIGRWQPTDDLALITAVIQTNDLKDVYMGLKFSCKFSQKEIEQRWYSLLYDPVISKLAVEAMRKVPPQIVSSIQGDTLFSRVEESILREVPSTCSGSLEVFESVLAGNVGKFHPCRSAKSLLKHWQLMKHYKLLNDQKNLAMPKVDYPTTFSEFEEMVEQNCLTAPDAESDVDADLKLLDRQATGEIRVLENEIPKLQVLVEVVTGVNVQDFDSKTLAVLRGRLVKFLMKSREITIGRNAKDNQVDVDVSLDGPANKVSRRQAVIKLRTTGDFYLMNEGRIPLYVDGKPILSGSKIKLKNNSVVEMAHLRFVFLVNQELITAVRTEAAKLMIS